MKILLVTQYFWPENFRINDVAQGLTEMGHQVTVLTGLPNYPGGKVFRGYGPWRRTRESWSGIDIVRAPLWPRGGGGGVALALNYLSFMLSAALLGPLRVRRGHEVIFVYEPSPITVGVPALVLKWLRRIPVVFWVQDLWPESLQATGAIRSPAILGVVARLVRFIYRHCDRILVQSRGFVPAVAAHGVAAERIHCLPNSAEAFYLPLPRAECAREDAELPRGFRIVFAGNIGEAQDFATVIEAARLTRGLRDVHWVIIGDGRARAWVEAQVREHRLEASVHLLGPRVAARMPCYFAAADALLVTLRKEPIFAMTIPSKLQSYLACGRPVIGGLDGEGARAIEEAGAGLTCAAESPRELAAAVTRLVALPPAQRDAMGVNARRYYDANFERGMLLRRLADTLEEHARSRT